MSAGISKQHGKRRVSRTLPLMLVTSAALTACSVSSDSADNNGSGGSQELTSIRDQYKNLEDCQKDWGTGTACETVASSTDLNAASIPASSTGSSYTGTSGSHYSGYSHSFFGPYYSPGYRDTVQRNFGVHNSSSDHAVSRSVSTSRSSVSRGGFGGTAHGHSGGG
ncbi:hypothetical protein [Undibacterium sp. Tian12W]|uniref:hypothetical protein n=1 Tax=Undibacterium sp. Tian12W TaxID=3413054 RepID=UPI003BF1FFCC